MLKFSAITQHKGSATISTPNHAVNEKMSLEDLSSKLRHALKKKNVWLSVCLTHQNYVLKGFGHLFIFSPKKLPEHSIKKKKKKN